MNNKFTVTVKEFDLTPRFFRLLFKVDPLHIDQVTRYCTSEHSLDSLVEKMFERDSVME